MDDLIANILKESRLIRCPINKENPIQLYCEGEWWKLRWHDFGADYRTPEECLSAFAKYMTEQPK